MLTNKQIENIALEYTRVCGGYEANEDAIPDRDVLDFARAIEKAVLFEMNVDANEKLVIEELQIIIDNLKFDMKPKWKAHLKLEKCGKCGRRFYHQKKEA